MPRPLSYLVAAHFTILKRPKLAVALLVQQSQGMRPNEMLKITKEDILLPELQGEHYNFAIIGLGARVGTQVKRQQSTVVRDPVLIGLLRWLAHFAEPCEFLFGASYSDYTLLLQKVCKRLGLEFPITPHSPPNKRLHPAQRFG
jgi:hypothetical protein